MYKILIIEDEVPARKKLLKFIKRQCPDAEIVAEIETVQEGIPIIKSTPEIDLIFSDIELRDDNVFSLYEQVTIRCPIIFTTAYDQFLMDAFEVNGIEYLLKPFGFERFQKAWNKFEQLRGLGDPGIQSLLKTLAHATHNFRDEKVHYKKNFAVKKGQSTHFIQTEHILYFQAQDGVIYAIEKSLKRHILSYATLKELEEVLDPNNFFRINRSDTVHRSYIQKLERYGKNAVAVFLESLDKPLITSQSKTAEFSEWVHH